MSPEQTETKADRVRRVSRERSAAWRVANPERVKELSQACRSRRKESWDEFLAYERARYQVKKASKLAAQKAQRDANPEIFRERVRASYRKKPEVAVAGCAERRARKNSATPPWVDRAEIKAIYAEARRLTAETGIKHEVDHIHPLKGRLACGLHVPWNLQIITRTENRKKHNRHVGGEASVHPA